MEEPKPIAEPEPLALLFDESEKPKKKKKASRNWSIPWGWIIFLFVAIIIPVGILNMWLHSEQLSGEVVDKYMDNNETYILVIKTENDKNKELHVSKAQYDGIRIGDSISWDENDKITEIRH